MRNKAYYSYVSLHTPYLRFLRCCCSSTSTADTRCSCSCWRQQGHLAQPKARSAGRSFSPSTTHSTSLQTFYTLLLHLFPPAGFDCDSWRCDSDIGRQTRTETHWEANKKEEKGKQTRKEKKFRRCDVAAKATVAYLASSFVFLVVASSRLLLQQTRTFVLVLLSLRLHLHLHLPLLHLHRHRHLHVLRRRPPLR